MPNDAFLQVKIDGADELEKAIAQYPRQSARYLKAAGNEAAKKVILTTEGLKKYPPATVANRPPTPYYKRGYGMQRAGRRKPEYNDMKSENLGKQFYVQGTMGGYATEIGNRASYADYVVGEGQAHFMKPKGWRKLREVAEEKIIEITQVYNGWVQKLLRDIGLK